MCEFILFVVFYIVIATLDLPQIASLGIGMVLTYVQISGDMNWKGRNSLDFFSDVQFLVLKHFVADFNNWLSGFTHAKTYVDHVHELW